MSTAWAISGASGGEKSVPRETHSPETSSASPTEPSSAVQPWLMEITVAISQKPRRIDEIGASSLATGGIYSASVIGAHQSGRSPSA